MNYIQQYIELIPTFPFIIQVAIYFILLNTLLGIVFGISLLFYRRKRRKIDELDWKFRPLNVDFFRELLKSSDQIEPQEILNKYENQFGKIKKNSYLPMIGGLEDLLKEDKNIQHNINFPNIISGLKIEEYLQRTLKFSSTKNRLSVFQSISNLGLRIPDSMILPFAYSKNLHIRRGSRNNYTGISNHDPFKFFELTDNDMNYWDQIFLMQQLEIHHKDNLPNFSRWIRYSKNPLQLIFIVKAVAHFKQESSIPALIETLSTENHQLRKEVIKALGKLKVVDAEEKLINSYNDQPLSCQNEIVESVLQINSGRALPFLKSAYQNASTNDSKKLIIESIYEYNEEGRRFVHEIYNQEDDFGKLIIDHVKNPLIPSRLRDEIAFNQNFNNN